MMVDAPSERELILEAINNLNHTVAGAVTIFTEATNLVVTGIQITPARNEDGSVGYSMSIKIDNLEE